MLWNLQLFCELLIFTTILLFLLIYFVLLALLYQICSLKIALFTFEIIFSPTTVDPAIVNHPRTLLKSVEQLTKYRRQLKKDQFQKRKEQLSCSLGLHIVHMPSKNLKRLLYITIRSCVSMFLELYFHW